MFGIKYVSTILRAINSALSTTFDEDRMPSCRPLRRARPVPWQLAHVIHDECIWRCLSCRHTHQASRGRTDRETLDGLLRRTQAQNCGAAAIWSFTSDSSSSLDARGQPVHLRLSRTCKNSSGRTWMGGPPQDSNSNWDLRDQSFRPCSNRSGNSSCGTPGRWPCLRPPPP